MTDLTKREGQSASAVAITGRPRPGRAEYRITGLPHRPPLADTVCANRAANPVPTFRCFCLTADGRVITGALIEAKDLTAAVEMVRQRWRAVVGFRSIELWLGQRRLCSADNGDEPGNAPASANAVRPETASRRPAPIPPVVPADWRPVATIAS